MLKRPKWSAFLKQAHPVSRRLIRTRPRLRPPRPPESQQLVRSIPQPFDHDTRNGCKEHIKSFHAPKEPWSYYRYHALPGDTFAMRLMELKPGTGDIHCELHNAHLGNEGSEYTALSYTWGTQILQQFIWCDGKVFPITQNLHDALSQLRDPNKSIMLWIDAICINQANDDERGHQVNLMRYIFNRAGQVVVWLGEERAQTKTAFSFIERLAAATSNLDPEELNFKSWSTHKLDQRGLPPFTDPQWHAILQFFHAPYFQRIWVIQELVVSSSAVVRYGNSSIAWAHVAHVARLILATVFRRAYNTFCRPGMKISRRDPVFAKTIANIRLAFTSAPSHPSHPSMSLEHLLWVSRRFCASDPKDKILALVGMASNTCPRTLPPHPYSIPTPALYTHITASLLLSAPALTLLSCVEDISRRDPNMLSLPSWVPDYSVWHGVMSFGFPFRHKTYRASGSSGPRVSWSASAPRELRLCGRRVDTVQELLPGVYGSGSDLEMVLRAWLGALEGRLDRGELEIGTFWRTLLGDSVGVRGAGSGRQGVNMAAFLHLLEKEGGRDGAGAQEVPARKHWEPLLEAVPEGMRLQAAAQHFENSVESFASRRRMFVTREGRLGLGPRSMLVGDEVVLFEGARVPFLMRRGVDGWRLVGESFVWGAMWGELAEGMEKGEGEEFVVF